MPTITHPLDQQTQHTLLNFYQTPSEKDRHRYAAVEAQRFGYGGITRIAEILGCSVRTIARGLDELPLLPNDPAAGRVRRPGSGRKKHCPRLRRRAEPDHRSRNPHCGRLVAFDFIERRQENPLDNAFGVATDETY